MPYGEKSEEQLIEFADKIFKFFEEKKAKAVIMACNTTSAVTYEKLKITIILKFIRLFNLSVQRLQNLKM